MRNRDRRWFMGGRPEIGDSCMDSSGRMNEFKNDKRPKGQN